MIKKIGLLLLGVFLLLTLSSPVLVHAQGGIEVQSTSTVIQFPLAIQFNLSATSDVNITDIRLRYSLDMESFAQVTSEIYAQFVPSTEVDVSSVLNMIKTGGLPTGSSLEYWWVLKDAKGRQVETEPTRLHFDDTRYSWQKLTQGMITLYWYDGGQSFAQGLMTAAQQALVLLAKDTGAQLNTPVSIYIYASPQDLQGAMIYPQEWTGGVTFSQFGIIAIGIATNNLDWGKRAISHELTHMVNHQMTSNPFSGLPVWLDEGLAKYAEGPVPQSDVDVLDQAIVQKSLISVRSLASPFSAYPSLANLSYVESRSVVGFLISNYGQAKMLELLNTFKNGSTYDGALKKVYGFDMDGLNTVWTDYIAASIQPTTTPVQPVEGGGISPILIGVLAGVYAVLLVLLSLLIARRRRGK